jgi:hypothetical protein
MRCLNAALLAALLAGAAACSDTTSSDPGGQPADFHIIQVDPTSPQLFNPEQSFYAVQGQDRELHISFQDASGAEGEEFLRLRVRSGSLLANPDGSAIAPGDSVLITVRVVNADSVLFEMEPSGLTFNPVEPAELKIHYAHADHDFNDDGSINAIDDQIKTQLAIWRQETPGTPFTRLGSVNVEESEEVNADILGFTRYAIAY